MKLKPYQSIPASDLELTITTEWLMIHTDLHNRMYECYEPQNVPDIIDDILRELYPRLKYVSGYYLDHRIGFKSVDDLVEFRLRYL